jgi:acetone carboxylase gamma subunit
MTANMLADVASEENLRRLVEGNLPYEDVKKLIRMDVKDEDRFWKYLKILQEKVSWKDKILLRLGDHLYIVQKDGNQRVVKCDCGHEFGDYRQNWKLNALVNVRSTPEEFLEIRPIGFASPDHEVAEVREFYCPGCVAQLAVEVVPHGYPFLFEMLPDLDTFYREILGKPLPGESEDKEPLADRSVGLTKTWAAGQ